MRLSPGLLAATLASTTFAVAQAPLSFELSQNGTALGLTPNDYAVQADFNGDGKPDIITQDQFLQGGNTPTFSLRLGNGDGDFSSSGADRNFSIEQYTFSPSLRCE